MLSAYQMMQTALEHVGLNASAASWSVGESPLGGRGILATRDIAAGEVLFTDRPLVYGPRAGSTTPRGCTVCWRISAPGFIKCHICALTLCSEKCQNSEIHANDCAIICRWISRVSIEEIDDTTVSKALTPIRALTLDEQGKRFLGSLKAHESPQHGSEIKDLKQYFEISEEEEEFMVLACRVLDTNAFQIPSAYCREEMSLRGLYPVAGLMNHSCMSNTKHSFDRYFGMTVKATKCIPAGAEVLTCYAGLLWGTPARRRHLYKTKHFLCACARCADPTERGTLLAALKCFSPECQGSLLPIEPLKMSTAWRCLDCSMLVPATNICAIQAALGSLMGTLNFENAIELEEFLEKRITKFVPRTNQIVVDLQCRLIWLLGETDGLRWHGPRPSTAEESFCTICFTIDDACFQCDICRLSLCSEACRSSDAHVMECKFLHDNWKPKLDVKIDTKLLSIAVIYVRALLLDKETITLLSILQKSKTTDDVLELKKLVESFEIPNEQVDYMKYVISILKINSFRVSSNNVGNKVQLRGLYPVSSFLNHSCMPNTRNTFSRNHMMAVYAARDIEPGEEIFTSYTGLLLGTLSRRHQLFVTKGFWCTCCRCEDATENGTKLSGINCLNKNCTGIILPVSPLDHKSAWSCDKCENEVQASRVNMILSVIGSLLNSLNLDGQLKLDRQILERLVDLVPFCSHVFVDIKLRIALKLGFTNRIMIELSEARLALKERLCRGALRTAAALCAGDSHLRGLLLYHLHAALAERARRHPETYEELKSEIESTIEQSYNILEGDMSAPPDLELRLRYLGPGCDKPPIERFFILDNK